jgi:uncharacterized membrane protein YphA (DoxX/SURF4 family)
MRADYVDRFNGQWTGGLKRMVTQGAWFQQAAYPYLTTVTCAGHATISTGSFPHTHGVFQNTWWDREQRKQVSCTADSRATSIGGSFGPPSAVTSVATATSSAHFSATTSRTGPAAKTTAPFSAGLCATATKPRTWESHNTPEPLQQTQPRRCRGAIAITRAKGEALPSQEVLDEYTERLARVLAGYEPDIKAYRHALWRNQKLAVAPGAEQIPNEETRLIKRAAAPTGEPGASIDSSPAQWRSDVEALQTTLEKGVAGLASENQLRAGPPPEEVTRLREMAIRLMWVLLVGGACLVAGLFTRTAALVLAVFLASVIASQPPWVAGTVETYSQGIELVALLVLGTSHVGRWGGLDFFVHHVLLRPFRKSAAGR